MTKHLSTQEFADAVEDSLPADRRSHLAACDACGREVAEVRALLAEAHVAGTVPEPSPLFWDHLSRRVRAATEIEPIVAPRWWESAWRPMVALGAVAGAVALVAVVYSGRAGDAGAATGVGAGTAAAGEPTVDEGSLSLVAQMASDLSSEDLQQAARPNIDATAAVIHELTPAQRAEFIRLIKAEIGNPE
jgi:hypothetical protein